MKLFIIGNGFDCYLHGLPTRYADFRKYLIKKYSLNNDAADFLGLPMLAWDLKKHDFDTVSAEYIVEIIDKCGGQDWNELESYLGNEIYPLLMDEFQKPQIGESDEDRQAPVAAVK